jgi:7-cyano-7-deazaguanine synthase
MLAPGTALVRGGAEVPDLAALDAEALRQPPTYVPNRNMMLLSLAAAYAEARGVRHVFYGAQAQDEYGYWDCTEAVPGGDERGAGAEPWGGGAD